MTRIKPSQTRTGELLLLGACLSVLSGCFLQPIAKIEREFNFVDYDAPALRLARPVRASLLAKDPKTGEWKPIGWGMVPAGAYVKGRAPKDKIEDILKKETGAPDG